MEIFGDSSVDNCSMKAINMTPSLQEPKHKSPKVKKKRKMRKKTYFTRKKYKKNSKNSSKKQSTLKTLHKLCKPVVSVTRLSASEIKQWCEKDSSPCQVENVSTQSKKSKSKHKVQKSKKFTRRKIDKQNHLYSKNNSKNDMKSPNALSSQETDIRNKKLLIEDLLKNIKQPYMKLQRIDQVINKIAQSFAKTIIVTECEASIQTEYKTNVQTEEIKEIANRSIKEIETQTELNVSVPEVQKLSLGNINTDVCPQNPEIEEVAVNSHTNEILQLNECTDSSFIFNSDTEIVRNAHKKCFKRKRKVICESDTDDSNDNANNSEIILNEVKKLRTSSPEKINKMNIVSEKHDVIKTKCIDENSKLSPKLLTSGESDKKSLILQENVDVPPQKLSILEKLSRLCDPDDDDDDDDDDDGDGDDDDDDDDDDDEDDDEDDDDDNGDGDDEDDDDDGDDNDNDNDNDVNDDDSDNISSSVSSTLNFECVAEDSASIKVRDDDTISVEKSIFKKIQESVQESFYSDKDFLQRYEIFKELKVFLIKLDALKDLHTKYSAIEIEKITNKLMNSFVNLNSSKIQHNNQKSIDKISFTSGISKDSNVNFEKSVVYTIPEKIQTITESPKNSSEKSSNLIRNMDRNKRLKIKKASHNLKDIFEDKSRNRQNVIGNLKQNSNVPTPAIKSSSQESTNKTSELLNMIENVNVNKSTNTMSSLEKQKLEIPSTENSVKSVTVRFPEKAEINTPQITNFKSHFSNQNEVEQTTFVSKTHKKSTNIIATNISVPTCYSSTMSSKKHNKPKDKKDTKNLTYKCIVCDFCFEDYSNLQQHLIIHTQKQIDSSLNTSNTLTEKSEETISQSSEVPELSQMSEHKHVEYASLQCESNKQEKKKNTIPKSLLNKKRRKNKIQRISNSNECSICSKIFPTATDLAAHIFLHTEKELQKAYKSGKQKLVKSKSTEKEKCKQTRTEQIEETGIEQNLESARTTGSTTVDNIDNTIEGIHKISDKEESFLVQKSNRLITKDPEIRDTESTVLKEHDSQSIKLDLLTKSSKEKINKTGSYKRAVTVCKCHNKPGINENNLQIEIVLLCHTCKVLFRSMECFETHYRLSEYTKCNQNRLTSSRSPNLFCANCGMMFSSVQDVRHHLETHVRFKQNCIMDFRCNICKVIFLGIGTLFYIHWSKHSRNPFWMASEQSFPKNSIINSKLKKIDNPCTQNAITLNSSGEQYIQVAEHVCNNCKLPFVTQDDLKNHDPRCKEFKTLQDTSVVENNSRVIIRMNCSLCNDTFINKKREFYNHIKNKHNCNIDPQFVCVSFSVAKVVYICNVCMAMTENLDAFENHWLKHNTTHINFTCAHCNNIYYNNLNSFIDHAEEHKSNTVVSCTINYTKAELICKFCDTGFDSSQDMYEHIVTHNISSQQTHSKIDQITNQDSPASTSQINCASTSEVKNVEKEIEKSPQMEAQVMEERSKTSPLRSNIDKDKEKLIRVLEGSEDDSENELIIDLARQPEESNEISTGKENREKQTTSNLTSDESSIDQTCAMSENNITKTLITNTNVQVSSQNISLSEPTENVIDFTARNINPQISLDAQTSNSSVKSTSVLQNSHSNNISNNLQDAVVKTTNNESVMKDVKIIENSESHDAILTGKQEELTTLTKESPKKQSLPRPKGFLRVKTLAELTGSAHFCKLCDCAIENANELAKHFKNHKDNSDHEIREKELTSKPLETNKFEKSLGILEKTLTKSNTTVTNSQKPQQLQTNTIQDRHLPSLQNITSAYHKNLPPYNFVRRTTAISRSTTSKSDAMPIKVNTSNISNSHTNIPDVQRTRVTSSINGNKQNPAVVTNSSNHLSYQKQNLEYWTQRKKLEKIDNRTMRPTEMIPATNQNSELYQQIIQTRIECAPSPVYSQYSFTAGTSNNSNQMPKQNQTKIVSQPVTANTSSVYYKSPRHGNGSMSIVINQTAPIQNICGIPTIGILQQPAQQQLYQQQVYSEPVGVMNTGYAQQSQNFVDCSEPNSYQLINNQYGISNRQPNVEVTAYEVRYICPYCVKNFLSNDLMQIHINDAHNFVCNICHLRLYNLNDLHLHKFKHKNYVNLM